ncbi:MAG: Gfo/Idh/MocA family oxidoreductase [Flaviaesturariibacter sp.]|nr:Gfo/Idh/MocA family oxidoreductase [Flaviaesturariibacter sp.]
MYRDAYFWPMDSFAIIGCGVAAAHHAREITSKGGLLRAVCDTDHQKAGSFAALYNARAYSSLEELLSAEKEVTIVCICTPNGAHAEHAIKSLQAGKHVLCESPLCLTGAAAWQLVETEKFSRRRLAVVDPLAGSTALADLKGRIEAGAATGGSFELSVSTSMPVGSWKQTVFPGGGLLYASFPGAMAALVFLFGPLASVEGELDQPNDTMAENAGIATLSFQGGMRGTIRWTLSDTNSASLNVKTAAGIIERCDLLADDGDSVESRYEAVFANLSTTIAQGMKKQSDAFSGLRVVEAIETIYKALRPSPTEA